MKAWSAQRLAGGDAENPLHAGVPHGKKAIAIERKNAVHAAVDEPFQQLPLGAAWPRSAHLRALMSSREHQAASCFRLLLGSWDTVHWAQKASLFFLRNCSSNLETGDNGVENLPDLLHAGVRHSARYLGHASDRISVPRTPSMRQKAPVRAQDAELDIHEGQAERRRLPAAGLQRAWSIGSLRRPAVPAPKISGLERLR